jgi:hypothetical protein
MKKGFVVTLSSLLTLNLAACAPSVMTVNVQNGTGASPTLGNQQMTSIAVRIVVAQGMAIKKLPGQNRVAKYSFELKNGSTSYGTQTLDANTTGLYNPSFASVPEQTSYTLKVDAMDSDGVSVLTGMGTATVDVANGVANGGAPITVSLTFVDGDLSDATTTGPVVTVHGPDAATKVGIALVNNGNRRATIAGAAAPLSASFDRTYTLSHVQRGATTGISHTLWYYSVDGDNKASIARKYDIMGTTGDIGNTPIAIDVAMPPGLPPFNVWSWSSSGPDQKVMTDDAGCSYFAASSFMGPSGIQTRLGPNTLTPFGSNLVSLVGVGGDGTVYFVDPGMSPDSFAVRSTKDGTSYTKVPGIDGSNTLAMELKFDGAGNIYWLDGSSIKMLAHGATVASPLTGITAGNYSKLAVDPYGNLYLYDSSNAKVVKATLSNEATNTYTMADVAAVAGTLCDMTVDPAGNLYFVDGAAGLDGVLKMHANGNTAATIYTVKAAEGMTASRVAYSATGCLYFTGSNFPGGPATIYRID